MNIKTSWTFGNFAIVAQTNLDDNLTNADKATKELLSMGLLQALQRVPSSKAESHMVNVVGVEGVPKWGTNKRGTFERPKDFKRNSIPFSEETAMALEEGFGTSVNIGTTEEPLPLTFFITSITKHEGGGEASRKMATEMAAKLADQPALLIGHGLTPESTEAQRIEACHTFLAGLRKTKAKA